MPVTIRPLERSDHAGWRRLWTGYLTFYETVLPEEVYAATWERLFADGAYEPDRDVVFVHTGGSPGLFAYTPAFTGR